MTTARRSASPLPVRDPKKPAPSGQYRMVTPRQPRRISGEYLDMRDGPIAMPMELASDHEATPKRTPAPSPTPKAIEIAAVDDPFTEEEESFPEDGAPEAPDSLVKMMEGIEGSRVTQEAWPKEKAVVVPKPPSVPKMEAVVPPTPLQLPVSRMTPRPLNEHQIIEDFAKFGPSPETIWQTPGYALHVRARKAQLKQELGLHRERRPSDVQLYEKALAHIDDDGVRRGWMVMSGAAALLALVIVIVCVLL